MQVIKAHMVDEKNFVGEIPEGVILGYRFVSDASEIIQDPAGPRPTRKIANLSKV